MKELILQKFKSAGAAALSILLLISLSNAMLAQENQYSLTDVAQTEAYTSIGFCRTSNYFWDQGVIDSEGNIYFVFVDNYKLFYHVSEDDGATWTSHQVMTSQDGHIFTARLALTPDGKLVIAYVANMGFVSGSVSYGSEFAYDLYGAVLKAEGWEFTSLATNSSNSGLIPYGIITTKSGLVHIILSKDGWWNYGGELYEVMYDEVAGTWSGVETIKIFNDRPVNKGTFHICKLAEGQNDSIICVYQRHASIDSHNNLEMIKKGADGWTEPEVILANSNYNTYNRFDLDYDRHGHYYFGYFIPFGPNGPEIYVGHNSMRDLTKYELFAQEDTLRKISIHPHPDAEAYIYLNFKDTFPKILKFSESGLELTSYLPEFTQADSMDVMRFHYQIPIKNNFSMSSGLQSFTNRYQGKEGNTVLSYPLVYVGANLKEVGTEGVEPEVTGSFGIYPNPGNGIIHFKGKEGSGSPEQLRVYNATGMMVRIIQLKGGEQADISDLPGGLYFIRDTEGASVAKYIKRR